MRSLLTRRLLALCLVAVFAQPAFAQSLLDWDWMKQATPAAVQALLDRGANVNARAEYGVTPLHLAPSNENPAAVALLLDRDADATLRDKENTLPFDEAKKNGKLKGTAVYWRLNDARFEDSQPSKPEAGLGD